MSLTVYLICNICTLLLWYVAYVGIKQYEFSQQDTGMFVAKAAIAIILLISIILSSCSYFYQERTNVVRNTPMVKEATK